MAQLITAAIIMGMLGSFHCVGMCGPLALSLPLSSNNLWAKFAGAFLYNAGRVVTYALFGLLFGAIGQTAALFGWQQWLSVILGAVIIVFAVLPKKFTTPVNNSNVLVKWLQYFRSSLGRLFAKRGYNTIFAIGILNGLLPCGMVYMAAAAATATGNTINAFLFMIFFGAGTLPVMWSLAFFGNYIGVSLRQKIRKAYPIMMAAMACLLILRGLGLNVPYISPAINTTTHQAQPCHAVVNK